MIKKEQQQEIGAPGTGLLGDFFFFLSEMICFLRGCTTDGTPHPRLWGWSRPWLHDLGRQGALNSNGLGLGSAQLRPPHFLRPGQSLLSPRRQQTQLGGRTQFLTGSSASIVCCRPLGVGRLREPQGPGVWRCSISALTCASMAARRAGGAVGVPGY